MAHRESAGDCLALNVLPVIRELQAAGATSHNAIAMKLNARNVPTARAGASGHTFKSGNDRTGQQLIAYASAYLVKMPSPSAAMIAADTLRASAAQLSAGRSTWTSLSFRAGAIRSKHNRSAAMSPALASSIALRVKSSSLPQPAAPAISR